MPASALALGAAGAGPPGDTDRGESAGKGWSLVCNGAGLLCDEGLATRPGGQRDVTRCAAESTAEIAGRAVTCDLPKGHPGPHFDVETCWQY